MNVEQDTINNMVITAINNINEHCFFPQLALHIRELVCCDSLVMMLYSDHAIPDIIHDEIKELSYRAFKDIYLQGAYLLSPLYVAHRQAKYGCFTLDALIPDGFYDSEYYLSYYSKCGLTDQLIILVKLDNKQTLAISLGLLVKKYTDAQQQLINDFTALLSATVAKHWLLQQKIAKPSLHRQLQQSFDLFASSVLTNREQAVVQTLMQGHSSKSAAKALNISVDTERSYRKSAYAKLDISSQSELFNLFFSCLRDAEQSIEQDPLLTFANQ